MKLSTEEAIALVINKLESKGEILEEFDKDFIRRRMEEYWPLPVNTDPFKLTIPDPVFIPSDEEGQDF